MGAKSMMETGDPTIPADVCEAKPKQRFSIEKSVSEGVPGSEDEPFAVNYVENYNKDKKETALQDNQQMKLHVVAGDILWHGAEGVISVETFGGPAVEGSI